MATTMTLQHLSKKMADMDFCMLSTRTPEGRVASRPMSNNGDVEYDGDSWFFSYENTAKVRHIEADQSVSLTFTAGTGLLGKPGIFVAIDGDATLIRDKSQFVDHWTSDLEIWFPQGVDTPGIVLIKVHAATIEYWDGEENGKVQV